MDGNSRAIWWATKIHGRAPLEEQLAQFQAAEMIEELIALRDKGVIRCSPREEGSLILTTHWHVEDQEAYDEVRRRLNLPDLQL